MIIDPVCALVFEAEEDEAGLMTRPPRPISEPLFSRATVLWSITQGVLGLAGVVGLYLTAQDLTPDQIRAVTFAALVVVIFALILVNRRRSASITRAFAKHNRALGIITAVIAGLMGAVMFFAPLRGLFGFALPAPIWWAAPPLVGVVVLIVLEGVKAVMAKANQSDLDQPRSGTPR